MVTTIIRRARQENIDITTGQCSSTAMSGGGHSFWKVGIPTVATHNLQLQFGIERESYNET
jgi:hypothetical protein